MGTDRNVSEPERSEYKGNLIYHSIQATLALGIQIRNQKMDLNIKHIQHRLQK